MSATEIPGFENTAKRECRVLFEKVSNLPPALRELTESLIVLAFSAGAAWASGIDWNTAVLQPPQTEKRE